MRNGTATVPVEQLQLSKAPHAELTSAAVEAGRRLSGGAGADFIVVALEPGRLADAEPAIRAALEAL